MLNERPSAAVVSYPASGFDYPGPALDIEDCIIESNLEGFNKTLEYMLSTHGRGPWLNQAIYMVCMGSLVGIDEQDQREMFNAMIEHFDPAGESIDLYLDVALALAPWAAAPMVEATRARHGESPQQRQHIEFIACQKAIEGHMGATHLVAPGMFLNYDLCQSFWQKTMAHPRARETLWSGGQWRDDADFSRLLAMGRCAQADHLVAKGLFGQSNTAMDREQAGDLAVHLVERGWLTSEATAIAMAGAGPHQKDEQILARVVSAQMQRRTQMLCAAAMPGGKPEPGHGRRRI